MHASYISRNKKTQCKKEEEVEKSSLAGATLNYMIAQQLLLLKGERDDTTKGFKLNLYVLLVLE